ncbi:MAG TPA: GNAT family N-acetyltransferase [Candidatus Synoicihabitans sp.]|nr:GNAT family N-acetyltransferase [Candidatus Synoicihabitans sp.]
MDIRHEEDRSRFVVETEHGEAVADYHRSGQTVDFTHTFVPPESRGRGIAEALVKRALDWAESQQLQIHASCWYVARIHGLRNAQQKLSGRG